MNQEDQIVKMQAEIDSIDIRINRAWEGIKVDLARKEWLRIQLLNIYTNKKG